ncbi:MAG: energy transducer TonB [Acidobacteriia bacterium]|nr:energy transducer TonB [Terriglobia bacterium]
MRSKRIRVLLAVVVLFLTASLGFAQKGSVEEEKRKVRLKVAPTYPELARRMNISGKVKLEVVVTPDGLVRTSRVIGGHPLLVNAAQSAVKEWKFAPGTEETTVVVTFEFKSPVE